MLIPAPRPPTTFLVEHRKIVLYLLNPAHPDGRPKAQFFQAHGFSLADPGGLARSLLDHPVASSSRLAKIERSIYAPRFVYEGVVRCPDGTRPHLRSVWELRPGDSHGRLLTAYPCAPAIPSGL